jgi:hypothetical protein
VVNRSAGADDDTVRDCFRHPENDMPAARALASIICIAVGVAATARPALAQTASPHPSVIIGNKPSVRVGQGVFVGKGNGSVALDDPNAPNKTRCAILDGVSYCY